MKYSKPIVKCWLSTKFENSYDNDSVLKFATCHCTEGQARVCHKAK